MHPHVYTEKDRLGFHKNILPHPFPLNERVDNQTTEIIEARKETEKSRHLVAIALLEIDRLKEELKAERADLQHEIRLDCTHETIVGHSDEIKDVFHKIEQIARTDTTVLLLGETGTGKGLVAEAIHGLSLRRNRVLVKVNCAALPSHLIESELFGHEKGAFTDALARRLGRFEIADGATLFLDEVGDLPLELQPKLLQVIQSGEFERLGSSNTKKVDVRIIAATNRNLEEDVQNGRFREDLWYRLNVFQMTMPPLRDHAVDIPLLVNFYVAKISKKLGKNINMVPEGVMDTLRNYPWPGNVRELENVLERAVINSSGSKLRLMDHLKKPHKGFAPKTEKTMQEVERDYIFRVLEKTQWKVSGKNSASDLLGLNRSTLRARMRKLDIHKK